MYGIPGYDHLLPDESEAGEQAWRAEVGRFGEEAGAITAATPAEAVTLGCVREAGAHEQDSIDMAPAEHTVTAMQFAGPATFLAVAARTVLVDPEAAEAYLARLRGSGTWFGQLGERLRTGAGKGRLPVAPLAERAIAWAQDVLPGLEPGVHPAAPAGLAPRGGVGAGAPGGGRRGGAAGAGRVGGDGQGAAAAGPAVRPGRAGLAAGRAGGLHPGHPDLHHPAPLAGGAASDRPGSGRRAGGPGRAAGRRARAVRAGRGVRRAARLGRARSPPRRPSARRWPRCGGPRRGPASCSRSRCRHRARSRRCRRSSR